MAKKSTAPKEPLMGAGYDDVPAWGEKPPEGQRFDFSLVKMEPKISTNGNPMGVATFILDVGEFAGASVNTNYVFGLPSEIGEKQFKSLSIATGFRFQGKLPLSQYCSQWVDHDEPLRLSWKIKYEYSIEQEGNKSGVSGGWKNNVPLEEYLAWEGNKGIKIILISPKPPDFEEPELSLSLDDDEDTDDEDFDDEESEDDDEPF